MSKTGRWIACVGERRRQIGGAILIVLGVMLALVVLVTRAAFWLAFVALLLAWGGAAYAGGGRSKPDVGSIHSASPESETRNVEGGPP